MCKCRILEAANVDAYLFDNMVMEELAIQDVVKATTLDFACTVDRLKRTPENPFLLRHVIDIQVHPGRIVDRLFIENIQEGVHGILHPQAADQQHHAADNAE